jgi:hypothetical protein
MNFYRIIGIILIAFGLLSRQLLWYGVSIAFLLLGYRRLKSKINDSFKEEEN